MERALSKIRFEKNDDICKIQLFGYLNETLEAELVPGIERHLSEGYEKYVFDFSAVNMLDSPAIAVLLDITEMIVSKDKGKVSFAGLNSLCKKVLEMVGFYMYADVHETVQDAMDKI